MVISSRFQTKLCDKRDNFKLESDSQLPKKIALFA